MTIATKSTSPKKDQQMALAIEQLASSWEARLDRIEKTLARLDEKVTANEKRNNAEKYSAGPA